jgi:hypothetical protein
MRCGGGEKLSRVNTEKYRRKSLKRDAVHSRVTHFNDNVYMFLRFANGTLQLPVQTLFRDDD